MISLKGVSFRHKSDIFLQRQPTMFEKLNAVFPSGSHVALLGPTGSGKTTLLRLLSGLLEPTSGVIGRYGTVSFPMGFSGVNGRASVQHYVQFVARCYGLDPVAFLRKVVAFAEMEDLLTRPIGKLEGERRNRLSFTVGLMLPFDHYLFDQKIIIGEAYFQKKFALLYDEIQRRAGIVFATRKVELAVKYCSSAAVLHDKGLTYFSDINRAIEYYVGIGGTDPIDPHYTSSSVVGLDV